MTDTRVSSIVWTCSLLLCFSVVLYFTSKELIRYIRNEDTSSVAFKKFNAAPQDKYPTFSLCFYGKGPKYKTIYNKNFFENINMSIPQYWEVITGNVNASIEEIKKIPEFPSATITLKEMVTYVATINDRAEVIHGWHLEDKTQPLSENNTLIPIHNSSDWPFYISYQNPNKICYTKHVHFEKNSVTLHDKLRLDGNVLMDVLGSGYIFILVHYPHQVVREAGKEVYYTKIVKESIMKRIVIHIHRVDVLRKRSDAPIPCDLNLEDEDTYIRNIFMRKVGCIPPYWIPMDNLPSGLVLCTSSKQLKEAYDISKYENLRNMINQHDPPCVEMTVSSSTDMQDTGAFENMYLKFHYRADKYLETVNKRNFGLESLWSSVGGFVGMFLGYSVLQVPHIMITNIHRFIRYCFRARQV